MGERNYITTVTAYVADALYQQQRADEAEELTHFVEEHAAADDYA